MLVYNLFIAAIVVICTAGMRSDTPEVRRISLFFLILWGFTVAFGVIYETRAWLPFVPYLVLVIPTLSAGPAKPEDSPAMCRDG